MLATDQVTAAYSTDLAFSNLLLISSLFLASLSQNCLCFHQLSEEIHIYPVKFCDQSVDLRDRKEEKGNLKLQRDKNVVSFAW